MVDNKTITPSPSPLPEGRGIYKDKGRDRKNNERRNTQSNKCQT